MPMTAETQAHISHSLPPSMLYLHALTTVVLSEFPPLPSATLLHLATLPSLKHMSALIHPHSIGSIPSGDTGLFPALETLKLAGFGSDITRVLDVIGSPKITNIWLNALQRPTCSLMSQWIRTIACHHNLERFVVDSHPLNEELPVSSDCVVDSVALQPLFQLSMLRRLCSLDTPLQLDDGFIHDLALCCPRLQILALGSRVRWMTTGVTLEGLKFLSIHCSERATFTRHHRACARCIRNCHPGRPSHCYWLAALAECRAPRADAGRTHGIPK